MEDENDLREICHSMALAKFKAAGLSDENAMYQADNEWPQMNHLAHAAILALSAEGRLTDPTRVRSRQLRDKFALQALSGMMALSLKTDGDFNSDVVVRRCWEIADQMMEGRDV